MAPAYAAAARARPRSCARAGHAVSSAGTTAPRPQSSSAHRRRHLSCDRAGCGGERTAGGVLRPRDLAGEPLQRRGGESEGRAGHCAIHATAADFRGLADPFDPIAALHHAASYLSDLRKQFGNLGLAAAGYNAGPGRVSAWLGKQRELPSETRNYVAIITGWTADEWASSSPPKTSETTIPQGAPCTQLANLILAKPKDAQRIATYVPPWGAQFAADVSESTAWATYRTVQKRFAALIGSRAPMVLRGRLPGRGFAQRYMIRIADNSRTNMENLCAKIISAGGGCAVLRNGPAVTRVSV